MKKDTSNHQLSIKSQKSNFLFYTTKEGALVKNRWVILKNFGENEVGESVGNNKKSYKASEFL
jgi:hypothetical protein